LVAINACIAVKEDGSPCRAPPLQDSDYCSMHDPEHAKEAQEARRLGGLRRRKEKAVQSAYDVGELEDVGDVRRLIKIAVVDTLSLENSIARSRTIAYLSQVALKALEVGALEERLVALEATLKPREPAKSGRGR
jgi:hypothetical protein